jgi:hypothetical protein
MDNFFSICCSIGSTDLGNYEEAEGALAEKENKLTTATERCIILIPYPI